MASQAGHVDRPTQAKEDVKSRGRSGKVAQLGSGAFEEYLARKLDDRQTSIFCQLVTRARGEMWIRFDTDEPPIHSKRIEHSGGRHAGPRGEHPDSIARLCRDE